MTKTRLQVRSLTVRYGQHQVVNGISFDVHPGEMVALLGANGSGKSTTVKALTGVTQIGAGSELSFDGKPLDVVNLTPPQARRAGIRVVHQESPLISNMTVAEMVALHLGFPHSAGLIKSVQLRRQTERLLAEFDVPVRSDILCAELSAGERALVSLAISMAGIQPKQALLILDEATASLSTTESDRFLDRVRAAADEGLAVIAVTHRLPEVRTYCDRTVVLREGRVSASFDRTTFAESDVVAAMVGDGHQHQTASAPAPEAASGERDVLLAATGLSGPGVEAASLTLCRGEILGVTGRFGEGASELLRLLGGVDRVAAGSVSVNGRQAAVRSSRDAIESGVFYLSPDRIEEGGIAAMSVWENLVLPKNERFGLSRRKADAAVSTAMTALAVRPADPLVAFSSLSGGNQQKVLLARWLLLDPTVLILDDPTAGVDPNTRELMFATLRDLAGEGVGVILRSTEPEHLQRLCNRVLVMRQGRTHTELTGDAVTIEEISRATYA